MTASEAEQHAEELQLIRRSVERFAGKDHVLSELLLAASLTRSFDLRVLAAMIEREPDDKQVTDAFDRLIGHSLVESRSGGQWALHELLRRSLNSALAEDPQHRERLLDRLEEFHLQAYTDADQALAALAEVGSLMRQVRPIRFARTRDLIEDRLIRSAVQVIWASVAIDWTRGQEQMSWIFPSQESRHRLSICEVLQVGYAESVSLVPEKSRPLHLAWATYFAGRLANDRDRWWEAERLLTSIDPELLEQDEILWAWVLNARANALRGLCRPEEAKSALRQRAALGGESQTKDGNSAVPLMGIVDLENLLWRPDEAVLAARQALAAAQQADDDLRIQEVGRRLVPALLESGARREAIEELAGFHHRARTSAGSTLGSSRIFGLTALGTLGPHSRRLFTAISEQTRQLGITEWPHGELELRTQQTDALIIGGDAIAAGQILDAAIALAAEHAPDSVREFELTRAGQAEVFGASLQGAQFNEWLADDPSTQHDLWTVARCLSNAGVDYLNANELDRAEACLERAVPLWRNMGHHPASTWVRAALFEIRRRRGDLTGAEPLLDEITIDFTSENAADIQMFRANLLLDLHRPAEAVIEAEAAVRSLQHVGRMVDVIRAQLLLTQSLALESPSEDGASRLRSAADELASTIERRAAFCQWQSSPGTELADEHGGRALRIILDGRGDMTTRRRSAREHLNFAVELDPANIWFAVELAFVDLADDRPKDARQSLKSARKNADDQTLRWFVDAVTERIG